MNIEHKRFTEAERQTIQRYVLQGVQDGEAPKQIKDKLAKEEQIEITNAYVSQLSRKVRERAAESATTVSKILTTKQRPISRDVEQEEEAQWEFDLEVAKNFIKFINMLMTYKEIRSDLAERLNAERMDILHELEMKELTQEEKLAMLDKIADLGRRRREAKDYNEIFAPVTEFLADAANMNLIKVFANRVAEAVNKVKELDMRVYFMRGSGEYE